MPSNIENHKINFTVTQLAEGRTGGGQQVRFSAREEDVDIVKQAMGLVEELDIPSTKRVLLKHGGYGAYTRYDVEQHRYAGGGHSGGGGFIEVLEIKNPPDDRHGIVIYESDSLHGTRFTEFDSLEHAKNAFEGYWSMPDKTRQRFPQKPGFMRSVECGRLTPWFYAIGDEELVGDYAFPEGLQDDPVFRFGRQFLVERQTDKGRKVRNLKTCMGTRFVEYERGGWAEEKRRATYRLVYWDDGTISKLDNYGNSILGYPRVARPVEGNESWIADAMDEFRAVLEGGKDNFSINFADGTKFVGRVKTEKKSHAEGNYFAVVKLRDGITKEGWVEFTPTVEAPTVQQFIAQQFQKTKAVEVESIEITHRKTTKGGKKWSGVFYGVKD